MTKKRFLIVIPDLGAGGAEKCAYELHKGLQLRNESKLIILGCTDVYSSVGDIGVKRLKRKGVLRKVGALSRVISSYRPDVIISFLTHCNLMTWLAAGISIWHKCPLILSERASLGYQLSRYGLIKREIVKIALKIAYGDAGCVVTVSKGLEGEIKRIVGYRIKTRCIYNGFDLEEIRRKGEEDCKEMDSIKGLGFEAVVSVARLEEQKDHKTLLKAFRRVLEKRRAVLVLVGDGTQRRELEHQARNLGMEESVVFCGFQKNPYKYMKRADVVVLSTHAEGLPGVLIQAIALGKKSVATDVRYGVNEVLGYGRYGYLVKEEDAEDLAEAICRALDSVNREAFNVSGSRRFGKEQFIQNYENLAREMMV